MKVSVSHAGGKTLFPKLWCKHKEKITDETVQLEGSIKMI